MEIQRSNHELIINQKERTRALIPPKSEGVALQLTNLHVSIIFQLYIIAFFLGALGVRAYQKDAGDKKQHRSC